MQDYYALLCGIAGSMQLHLARCLQMDGIETYRYLLQKFRRNNSKESKAGLTNYSTILYILGILLSNSAFIWIVLANRFGSANHFTSMYCTGLIVVFLHAYLFGKISIKLRHWAGLLLILAGTALMGKNSMNQPILNFDSVRMISSYLSLSILFLPAALIVANFELNKSINMRGLINGLAAGSLAAFDPVLKNIGQNLHYAEGTWPGNPSGWLVFCSSLIFTTASFLNLQKAFARGLPATVVIPAFNVAFVCLPFLIWKIMLPQYIIKWTFYLAAGIMTSGLYLTRRFAMR